MLVKGVFSQAEVAEMRESVDRLLEMAVQADQDRNASWEGEFYITIAEITSIRKQMFEEAKRKSTREVVCV